jgi:1-acyl-sn-glycerol-3-phosphate acyltransferase
MAVLDSLWLPRSTCGTDCLPEPQSRVVPRLVVLKRIVVTGAVLLLAGLSVPVLALLPQRGLLRAQRGLARAVLAGLGIRHSVSGRIPQQGALLVANHVSWLDVIVILAHAPARLLAKREVRAWPLIGRLAATLGTVFVDRSRPKSLPSTVAEVRRNIAAGGVVAVFPEGTTWCGRMGGTFRPAMFQAAVDAGVPVVPVAIRGTRSILRGGAFVVRRGAVEVSAAPPIHPDGAGWHAGISLRDRVRAAILERYGEPDLGG